MARVWHSLVVLLLLHWVPHPSLARIIQNFLWLDITATPIIKLVSNVKLIEHLLNLERVSGRSLTLQGGRGSMLLHLVQLLWVVTTETVLKLGNR